MAFLQYSQTSLLYLEKVHAKIQYSKLQVKRSYGSLHPLPFHHKVGREEQYSGRAVCSVFNPMPQRANLIRDKTKSNPITKEDAIKLNKDVQT